MTPERIAAIRGLDWLTQPVFEPGAAIVRECLDEIERLQAKHGSDQCDMDALRFSLNVQAEHIRRLRTIVENIHGGPDECDPDCETCRLLAETEPV